MFIGPLQEQLPDFDYQIQDFPTDTGGLSFAQRMVKNGQVYHSFNYTRKKTSASYLIQFNENEEKCFGKIEFYVKVENDGFAVVKLFKNLNVNITQIGLPPPNDPVLKEFWGVGYLGSHFTAVQITDQYKFVKCAQVVARVVFVENNDDNIDGYVSLVLKSYQHD